MFSGLKPEGTQISSHSVVQRGNPCLPFRPEISLDITRRYDSFIDNAVALTRDLNEKGIRSKVHITNRDLALPFTGRRDPLSWRKTLEIFDSFFWSYTNPLC